MRVKYPRTLHLPWSDYISDDDKIIKSVSSFENRRVIVTEKMDGENCSMYQDHIHARSLDSRNHPSRNWVKQFWGTICSDIPKGWRVCGENLFAAHSIRYKNLPSYFMGFSVWNDRNECLSWDETLEWFRLLGITSVFVKFDGIFNELTIRQIRSNADSEGYVVRLAEKFDYGNFKNSVAKYVRPNHVKTDKHWAHQEIIQNELRLNDLFQRKEILEVIQNV